MIIYTDTPRMRKALRALKTWLETSAEHLERSNYLGIVLLSCSSFSFSLTLFFPPYLHGTNEF